MEQLCDRSQARTGQVSVRHFRTIKVIGKGSYGKVLLVEKKDTKKMYALKILKKGEILRRNQLEHTLDERRILVCCCVRIVAFKFISCALLCKNSNIMYLALYRKV